MYQRNCSPLDLDGEPMPIEAFGDLYHVPGFKYEYAAGRADISVQRSAYAVVAAPARRILTHTEPPVPEGVEVEPAADTPVEPLESLWVNAFARTPDYYGWAVSDIRDDAQESLAALPEEPRSLHQASLVARWKGDHVAALLVNQDKTRPLIDVLCVRRDLRRRGLAEALAHRVAHRLEETAEGGADPVLCSGYLLANRQSAAWHKLAGFIELPDWLVRTHRYRCLRHNLQRGLVEDPFWARRRAQRLQADLNEMKEKRREDPRAYAPSQWLVPREEGSGEGKEGTGGDRIESYLDAHVEWVEGLEPV